MTESINATPGATPLPLARPNMPVPEGYVETPLWDPFEAYMGPLFDKKLKQTGDGFEIQMAFRVDDRHINRSKMLHGGMLLTFADACLGSVAWNVGDRAPCVTVNMQTNFIGAGKEGDLVVARAQLRRETKSMLFVSGEFFVEDRLIATAQSIWKVLGR